MRSPTNLKYFSAYIHTAVVKSLEFSSMNEDVKFKFGVTAQKLNINIIYIKTIIKTYVIN
jgi:hypothetical protein